MRFLSRAFVALITVGGISLLDCGNNLPKLNAEKWGCFGRANDVINGMSVVIAGPGLVGTKCADANVVQADLIKACKDNCEEKFRQYGLFSDFPFFVHFIQGCSIDGTAPIANPPCKDPPPVIEDMNGGPSDARIAIDSSKSTATMSINNQAAKTTVSGFIDLTFGTSTCASNCNLRISTIQLSAASFALGNDNVHDVILENEGVADGNWTSNGIAFTIPMNSLRIVVAFGVNNNIGSEALLNSANVHGTLARDYSSFTLSGPFDDGKGNKVTLDLVGTPSGLPPHADFQPKGDIECNAPGVANVTFSSAGSTDPDNDIVTRGWFVDTVLVSGGNNPAPITYTASLTLGSHSIEAVAMDARFAARSDRKNINVVDTNPPTLTASVAPDCLWPPNHKFVLYELGNGISASATDVCDSSPTITISNVVSNQPTLGGGSGNTDPEVKFGNGGLCVRSERDGTVQGDRLYTVTVKATDASNNTVFKDVVIRVPRDQGHAHNCPLVDLSRVVDDSDPRCSENIQVQQVQQQQQQLSPPPLPNDGGKKDKENGKGGCSVSDDNGVDGVWVFAAFACAAMLGRRRRRVAWPFIFVLGCNSNSASIPNKPLSGSVQGNSFTLVGGTATWSKDHSRLNVMLADYATQCGLAAPAPQNGRSYTEVGITFPAAKATSGTYAINTSAMADSQDVGVTVTTYASGEGGKIDQATTLIQSGNAQISQISSTTLAGGIALSQGATSLAGTFSVNVCP